MAETSEDQALSPAEKAKLAVAKKAEAAKKAFKENLTLKESIIALGFMNGDEFDLLVKPENMIHPQKKD